MKKKIDTLWLDEIHHSLESLQFVSERLYDLSTAFDETGNEKISRTLFNDYTTINNNIRQIHAALGRMLTDDVQKGQKQMAEIFNTILASFEEKEKNGKLET